MTTYEACGPIDNGFCRAPVDNTRTAGTLPPELAASLRAARVRRGWSLRQAARELGVDAAMVLRLETGARRPRTALARIIAET
jgi:ribosome-binding protein aMBF1 (putative translation factor)